MITGFGRAGALTGAEAFGVTPDILNLAKQVTNGVQPLGAVVAKKEIYDTFMAAGGPEYMLEFPHGYTYSAHPVACAAGVAALDLLVQENAVERVARARAVLRERACTASRAASTSPTSATSASPPASRSTPLPGEPAKRPFEIAMKCLDEGPLRPLRRRHDPARAAVHHREARRSIASSACSPTRSTRRRSYSENVPRRTNWPRPCFFLRDPLVVLDDQLAARQHGDGRADDLLPSNGE